jgi:hypothetical protein
MEHNMQHQPTWLFAAAMAILITASGCVGNGAATPAAPQVSSGSDSPLTRATTPSPEPGSIVQYGTGRATIRGRVTYGTGKGGAMASVGMLDSRNRETWVTTDINGLYAFTGVDIGESYMLTFSPPNAGLPPPAPIVRNVTLTQVETTVDAQLPVPN